MTTLITCICKRVYYCLAFVFAVTICYAQPQSVTTYKLSLSEALDIASEQSLDAMVAKDQMRVSYWQFRNYQADMLPALTFEGTLPSLNRLLTEYQKEDGTYTLYLAGVFLKIYHYP